MQTPVSHRRHLCLDLPLSGACLISLYPSETMGPSCQNKVEDVAGRVRLGQRRQQNSGCGRLYQLTMSMFAVISLIR